MIKLMTGNKKNSINSYMTQGSITKALLTFFFPVLFGTLLQLFYNTADTIIIGQFAGKTALAAVGGETSQLINLLTGFFSGVAGGAGVVLSQFYGADEKTQCDYTVSTSIITSLLWGALISVVGIIICPWLYNVTAIPEDVLILSVSYTRIYFCGALPLCLYNMTAYLLRACGDSKTPFYILTVSVIVNIVLDYIFTALFGWGVKGVAFATVISELISFIAALWILISGTKDVCLKFNNITFKPFILRKIFFMGFPAGIQSTLYCFSNILLQKDINLFGTDVIAAWTAFCKIDAVFWTVTGAVGTSVTTFSGINYGCGNKSRVFKGANTGILISFCFTAVCMVMFYYTGPFVLSVFCSDLNVINQACHMLNFFIPVWWTYVSIEILSAVIRGCGRSLAPMIISVAGCCVFRLFWLYIAVPIFFNIDTVMASYPVSWIVTSIMLWGYYCYIKNKM